MRRYIYIIFFISVSCKGQNTEIKFNNIIINYLNQKSDSIINRSTIKDLIKPNLSEINIYISEDNFTDIKNIKTFTIYGSVGRIYSNDYLPDDYKTINYKNNKINIFYSYLKKNKSKKFKIIYLDENPIYSAFEDESEDWLIIQCSNIIEVIKNPTFYIDKNDIVGVKEVDDFQCNEKF